MRKPFSQLSWRWLLLSGLLLAAPPAPAQAPPPGTDYLAALKGKDLSGLWHARQLAFYGSKSVDPFPESLGFIGADYQRFYLHYTSVQPVAGTPGTYRVVGKTRVKNNVCPFTGTLTVVKATRYTAPSAEYPQFREGELTCRVALDEDRRQPGSGALRGTMTTYFYLDKQGQPRYNTLETMDGFSNNECVATWTSYATGQSKPCHWGDFRIPQAGPLDTGAGEFSVSPAYLSHGWQTYMAGLEGMPDTPAARQARVEEKRQWWL